jgi:hypothetical protein
MDEAIADDMRALLHAFMAGDHEEVEFRASRVHLRATQLGRIEIANAAASVVAAHRSRIGLHVTRVAVQWLAELTGFAMPD